MWTAKDFETNKGRWSAIDFGGESQTDPINKLPPQQRDKAEAARRSKMGATKNMTPEPPLAQTPTPQPIRQLPQSPYKLPQNVSSAINTSTGLLSGLLKKASPQTSQAVNIAGKLTQPVAEQAVKVGAHGLSAGAEGVIRGMDNIVNLSSMGSEGLYNLLGIDMPVVSKEQREKDRQASEKLIGDIRSDLGVDPNKMSGVGNLIYNTATNIPQMMAGPIPFALSAAGGYAQDAEQKGANLGQSLAHGLVGGGTELMLESALGAVPGIKNLKNITKGGVKGFLKTLAGEALEEAITDPLINLSEKVIFNKSLPWYSKTEDAVINPKQMGQSALGGGLMATMLAPFGLGGNVQQMEQQAPIQTEQTIQQPTAQQEAAPTVEQQPRQESPILQKRRQAEQLRKEYEQIKAVSKLTPDELTIAENIRKGKLSAVPQGFNTQIINEVANAGRLYDQADGEVKAFNENRKQAYRDTFDTLLANSDKWKDKDLFGGARYSREIQERNIIDIAGQEDGQKIADVVFAPTHANEAKRNQSNTEYRNRIRQYKLSDKVHGLVKEIDVGGKKYKQINERAAAQMLLEKKLTENEIPASMDKNKVIAAAKELRKSYDELFALANEVRVNNGYAPIEYRKDYAPHFEDPKDPFVKMLKSMGFKVDDMELSTDIAGITHQFRPGTKFFSHFLRREGNTTDYDALEGFDKYLEGISDVIYHTEDIQRLRAFETAIRTKHADSNIKNRIAEIEASGLSQEEKQAAIDELFDNNRGHLGAYVTDLREYTNNLAGKKSISDRNMEHNLKRKMYNVMDNLTNQMAKGMISFNIGSALTNIIALTQGGAGVSTKNFFKAFNDTVANHWQDDGFVNRSTFLTNRKGSEPLTKTAIEKAIDVGMKPMELTDWLTSSIIVRGMYLDGIERGLSPTEAMKKADSYAARAIGDRSKGATPTAFNKKNPVSRLLTTFQLEVNNQLSFLFKDLPREGKELGSKWLAATIFKFLFGSYLFNQAYEFLTGRRPALDPVGTIKKAIEAETPSEGFANIKKNVFGQLPFVGGYLEGGRLPINAVLPDFQKMGDAGKNILDGNGNQFKNVWDFTVGALKNPATYLVSPIGGGGQAKKTIEGLKAFSQGASLSDTGRMRYPIPKTPLNAVRTGLFGQYSTPEAREYFDKNRSTLSPNQTQQVMGSEDPQQAYLRIMQERQINSLNQKIKDVAADDTLTRAEKDKKITELRQKIIELRN